MKLITFFFLPSVEAVYDRQSALTLKVLGGHRPPLQTEPISRASRFVSRALRCAALLLTLGTLPCLAAATLDQQINPPEANVGDEVTITFTLKNGSGEIHLPQVDGLQVLGTSIANSFTYNNGTSSSSVTESFQVMPTRAGDLTIPAFEIHLADGGTLHTQPMKLHVLSEANAPPPNAPTLTPPTANPATTLPSPPPFNPSGPVVMPPGNNALTPPQNNSFASSPSTTFNVPTESDGRPAKVFIVIQPQTTDAYVGQSIPMRIEFYLRLDVGAQQNSLPSIKGSDFLMNNLSIHFQQDELMVMNEGYHRDTWITAISAPKSGDFPLQMERDTYWVKSTTTTNLDPFGSFIISHPQLAHELINSNQLTIHVHPLPQEGRPANFTGAIGNLTVTGDAQPQTVAVGEPVTLRFAVSGTGNFDYVRCPSLPDDPAWKSYVPSSKTEYQDESHTLGVKTFEQQIIPKQNGTLPLPQASFSYFDPTTKQYVTTPVPLPAITVTGSAASAPAATANADSTANAATSSSALLPNRVVLGSLHPSLVSAYHRVWFWVIQAALLLALLLLVFVQFLHSRARSQDDSAQRLHQQNTLNQEKEAMNEAVRSGDARAFFIAARHVIQLQLGTEWRVKPEALTLTEIRQRDAALAETLEPLFAQTDEIVYSGQPRRDLDLAQWERRVRELLQPQPV